MADHHHEKDAMSYGSHSSYGSGHDGHTMTEDHKMGSITLPVDGAELDQSPKYVGVNFGHPMAVETVIISTMTGEMIELDVSELNETTQLLLTAPELQSDDYTVDWRARGQDGHIMSGSFSFTVE